MSDCCIELIGIFLLAPFTSVCIVFVLVQTGFLFVRLINVDQTYDVPTPVSISHLYYKLSFIAN